MAAVTETVAAVAVGAAGAADAAVAPVDRAVPARAGVAEAAAARVVVAADRGEVARRCCLRSA